MEEKLLYQLFFGGLFFGLLGFAIFTLLKQPKKILQDLLLLSFGNFWENLLGIILSPIIIVALPLIFFYKVFNKKD